MQLNASYAMRESGGEKRRTRATGAKRGEASKRLGWASSVARQRRKSQDGEAIVTLTAVW